MNTGVSSSRGDGVTALGHLRVLELAGPAGQACGKLMADMGADVIKVEPPEGDFARSVGPFYKDTPNPEGSIYFLNFNTNKRSITLDLKSEADRDTFRRLAATADVVIESFQPGYLDSLGLGYKDLSKINPGLVITSITAFGQTGPYRNYLGTDLVAQAMGGLMYIQGDDTKPPCNAPAEQGYQLSSTHAVYATLAALQYRRKSGRGQHVDVSRHEVVAHLLYVLTRYAYFGDITRRSGKRIPSFGVAVPSSYYECKDGKWISISVIMPKHWKAFVEWSGNEILKEPVWEDRAYRAANQELLVEIIQEFIRTIPREEFVREAQKLRLSCVPINSMEDVVHDPQNVGRGDYFVKSTHPYVGDHTYPGAPYRFSETPWRIHRPAPLLGQHKEEILKELEKAPPVKRAKGGNGGRPAKGALPLEGVRILDFTKVWAGPFGTRYLADLGAEVIKVESAHFPEGGRGGPAGGPVTPMHADINRSKLSITLDFQTPEGNELVKRLIKVSDIIIDNFSAGVLDRRGLGYEALKQVKPDIIMISMPGFGAKGPYADYVAYGQEMMSVSGMTHLWGYADSSQLSRAKAYYTDFASAAIVGCCMMVALEARNATGKGQYIELAQSEAATSTMGVGLLDYLVNGRNWDPPGNSNFTAAPHHAYPVLGDDQWCVIACWTQEHWQGLCKVAGASEPWTKDPRFATQESRWKNQKALDEVIAQWTRDYLPYQLMRLLQKAGVPAGVVQSGEELYHDIQLWSRDFVVELEHCPPFGKMEHTAVNVRLTETPGRVKPLTALGQDNYHVFCDVLGLGRDEVDKLVEKKVLY
ncbi:MAG: CoA transferase [Chloroflexi bacterium]|nr:CoA transferase [Chloroflexota bacterium]